MVVRPAVQLDFPRAHCRLARSLAHHVLLAAADAAPVGRVLVGDVLDVGVAVFDDGLLALERLGELVGWPRISFCSGRLN